MSKKVSDILPKTEILAQLAEEASELTQAALKLRRALDGTTEPVVRFSHGSGWHRRHMGRIDSEPSV